MQKGIVNMIDDKKILREFLHLSKTACYNTTTGKEIFVKNDTKFCDVIFDGLLCWAAAPAGSLATQFCPNKFIKSTDQGNVTKKCEDDGQWYIDEKSNKSWSNYSECGTFYMEKSSEIDMFIEPIYYKSVPIIKTVTHFGYGISLIALVVALLIFASIKKLRCARNKLHMHLFVTFIMRALLSFLKDFLFYQGIALYSDIVFVEGAAKSVNQHCSWICKAITSARQYFIVANYMMVLMEGVYLYNLMFLNLFSDHSRITVYYVLGWGLPVLFIIPWILLRIYFEDEYCWTGTSTYISLLINLPIALSVIISFGLFVTFLRVLCVKLNSAFYVQQRKLKYRKLAKSTLILVPLFGVPYTISLILSCYASKSETVDIIWLLFDQTFTSFQGFFAALIYCLFNGEVHSEIKQRYNSFRNKTRDLKRSRTVSHTQHISMPLQEDYHVVCEAAKALEEWQIRSTHF